MAKQRMTLSAVMARKPDADLAKIDATTEEDIRRHMREEGYDRHGVPNALKGYVYEIGTSRLPARPWKTLADVRMRDKIQARMREVFQEEMSKNGGNEGKWNVEEVETEE